MFDDFRIDHPIYKHYNHFDSSFDLPIGEIENKKYRGIIYFSKIGINILEFNYKENKVWCI
ncbi:MAG: hypothetical protein NZ903_02935, partial [Candidatus Micrarchaeota archaeon]|nr:hypothetical protein [Candidatus Micrarchaeota archaeon]